MFELSPYAVTAIMFGCMILLMVIGMPLAFSLGTTAMFSAFLMWGVPAFEMIYMSAMWMFTQITMVALPLFIFMGIMMERSGVMDDLFQMIYMIMGGIRGGLAVGIVFICVLVAACSGVSGAATVSMGIIAVPALLKRGYDKRMITGTIQAGGALGFLIPPQCTDDFLCAHYRNFSGQALCRRGGCRSGSGGTLHPLYHFEMRFSAEGGPSPSEGGKDVPP